MWLAGWLVAGLQTGTVINIKLFAFFYAEIRELRFRFLELELLV